MWNNKMFPLLPHVSLVSRKHTLIMRGGALTAPLSNVSRFYLYIGERKKGNKGLYNICICLKTEWKSPYKGNAGREGQRVNTIETLRSLYNNTFATCGKRMCRIAGSMCGTMTVKRTQQALLCKSKGQGRPGMAPQGET